MTAGTALKKIPLHDSFDQRDDADQRGGATVLQEDRVIQKDPVLQKDQLQKDQLQKDPLQIDQQQPLHECVRSALRFYLENMDGHDVDGLYRMVLDQVERPLIETVLESAKNNQTVAARMLGMSRGTLRKKLKALNLAT